MLNPLKKIFVILSVGLSVSACQTPGSKQSFAEITFAHLPPINVNVSKVEVENAYTAKTGSKHVEDRFPVSPATAMERWVIDRVRPVGGPDSGVLRLVITDAGVLETTLKKDKSVTGVFTKQQSHRYDLNAGARIEIFDSAGIRSGFSAAKAIRSITTREDVTLNDREKIWFEATEKLMADFNREMESNIRRFLGKWVK